MVNEPRSAPKHAPFYAPEPLRGLFWVGPLKYNDIFCPSEEAEKADGHAADSAALMRAWPRQTFSGALGQ